MSMRYRKGAHCIYLTEYHIVWIPRYRRQLITKHIKSEVEAYFRHVPDLAPDIEVKEVSAQPDHVHMVCIIPPRYSVAQVVQYIKTHSSGHFKSKYGFMQKAIWGREGIWSRGYFVSTVGLDEKTILAYVKHQGDEEEGQLKLDL